MATSHVDLLQNSSPLLSLAFSLYQGTMGGKITPCRCNLQCSFAWSTLVGERGWGHKRNAAIEVANKMESVVYKLKAESVF